MSGATFAARGPRGHAGEQGPSGGDGTPGAVGPSGAEAIAAVFDSATPTNRDAVLKYPDSTTIGPGQNHFIVTVVCHKRTPTDVSDASRTGVFLVEINGKLGTQTSNVNVQQIGSWVPTSSPFTSWTGTTTFSATAESPANSEFRLVFHCGGPAGGQAPDGCSWAVNVVPLGNLFVGS